MSNEISKIEEKIHRDADADLGDLIDKQFRINEVKKLNEIIRKSPYRLQNPSELMIQINGKGITQSVDQLLSKIKEKMFEKYRDEYRKQRIETFIADVRRIKGNAGF